MAFLPWPRSAARRSSFRFPLTVELLEDRLAPATLTVNTLLDSTNSGLLSLRDAITAVNAGSAASLPTAEQSQINTSQPFGTNDTIQFGVTGTITLSSNQTKITKSVVIDGPGSGSLSVSGNHQKYSPFYIGSGTTVTISGLTITQGLGVLQGVRLGGGILNNGALTVQNSVISGCLAFNGGAIYNNNGSTLTVQNSTLTENTANMGGGNGGAIQNAGTMMVVGSTLSNNTAFQFGNGGAIDNLATATVLNCTLNGNYAGAGGAIDNFASGKMLTIQNSTLSGNSCRTDGGGIYNNGGAILVVQDSTISGNHAPNLYAGGLFTNGPCTLDNTLIAGNYGPSDPDVKAKTAITYATSYNNLIGNGTGLAGISNNDGHNNQVGTSANPINPMLGLLGNNGGPTFTMALLPGSPAIDAGSNGQVPSDATTDQRGLSRIVNGIVDIGAYEYQPPATQTMLATSVNPVLVGQSITFTATVSGSASGSNTATGNVVFLDGTTALATVALNNGVATFTTSSLSPGTHDITAMYSGVTLPSFTFSASTSAVLPEVILPLPLPSYFAVGADAGGSPQVDVYNTATGALVASFYAFNPSFTGGVRVAVDDVNGDGTPDIIVAAGPGGASQVVVIDGTKLNQVQSNGVIASSALIASFFAFGPSFTGGVFVAAGTSSSGQNWIVAGAGSGGGPQVVVWTAQAILAGAASGTAPTPLTSFYAFSPSFSGGVTVALGDVNGDGNLDVIAGAGPGAGPQVIVVDGTKLNQLQSNGLPASSALLASFYAFDPSFTGGVSVSGGVTAGSQFNLIIGAGAGGGPQVIVVNGAAVSQVANNGEIASTALLDSFYAFASGFGGGVRVGFSATYGSSGTPALLTGAGPDGGPEVAVFDGSTFQDLSNFFALPQGFNGGLFVAGVSSTPMVPPPVVPLVSLTAPLITGQPINTGVTAGNTATFTASASGNPSPTVQWQVSTDGGTTWNNISGATSTTLSFATTTAENLNEYRAVFSNAVGTATTLAAKLHVNSISITGQPINVSENAGSTATFFSSASGNPSPTVQWQVSTNGGTTWNNISGATNPTLNFTSTAAENLNEYRAVYSNAAGTATTNVAYLFIFTETNPGLPFTDNFGTPGPNSQLSTNWTNQVGDFTDNGSSATGAGSPVNLATVNGVSTANVTVQATVSNIALGGFAELVARYTGAGDSNTYKAGVVNVGGTYTAEILSTIGLTSTLLVSQALTAAQFNGSGTIQFAVSMNSLTLTVNSTVVSVMDSSITAGGSVGMRGSPGAMFTNFSAM